MVPTAHPTSRARSRAFNAASPLLAIVCSAASISCSRSTAWRSRCFTLILLNDVHIPLEQRSIVCYTNYERRSYRRQGMLKTLVTMVRGRTALIAEELGDQNALLILDQQMRDATGALDGAKKALAVATAQESQEQQRLDATHARITDLETGAIATLEAERDASLTARALFTAEIAKLKGHVLQQQMR